MRFKTKKAFIKHFDTLVWYCIYWDTNTKQPKYINVMSYIDGEELFRRLTYSGATPNVYNSITTAEEFYSFVRNQLVYRLHGDANFEMSLGDLHSVGDTYKLSVYDQIEPNLVHIINYIITEFRLFFPQLDVNVYKGGRAGIAYE